MGTFINLIRGCEIPYNYTINKSYSEIRFFENITARGRQIQQVYQASFKIFGQKLCRWIGVIIGVLAVMMARVRFPA